ncbi:MAG: hypothetical protein ACTTKL_11250 [Treponema sp.]
MGEPLTKLPCTKEMFFERLQTREAKATTRAAAENAFGKAEEAQNQEKRSAET